MGKQRRESGGSSRSFPVGAVSRPRSRFAAASAQRCLHSRWRWVAVRIGLAVFAPLLVLAGTELLLRLSGYGHSTAFFVQSEDNTKLITNRRFGWQFMPRETATQPWPTVMAPEKPAGTTRVFVLGESAAQGTPAPAFGFARILQVMLEQQFPERRWEIINGAMRGINSHAVRSIAEDCARYTPDLFLIYMGNNETVGLYAPEPGRFNLAAHPALIQASLWAKSTKLAQLFENTFRALHKRSVPRPAQDMEFFRKSRLAADAPERAPVYDNFRANLTDICRATRASGAKVIAATVTVNVKDFPPLASLHRPGLTATELARWDAAFAQGTNAEARGQFADALTHYAEAVRVDDHFAEAHFRLARCSQVAGLEAEARRHYALARDWDALQFRTDGRQNDIVREVVTGARDAGLMLLDVERVFAESDGGVPGGRLFQEHVHFNFDGDYLLARTFLPAVAKALGLPAPGTPVLSRTECATALAFTQWDEISVATAAVRMTSRPPFLDQMEHAARQAQAEAVVQTRSMNFQQQEGFKGVVEAYRAALARRPEDWQIHFNLANLLHDLRDHPAAAAEYAAAVRLMPVSVPLRVAFAQALADSGKWEEAEGQLVSALRLDPEFPPAKEGYAQLTRRQRRM